MSTAIKKSLGNELHQKDCYRIVLIMVEEPYVASKRSVAGQKGDRNCSRALVLEVLRAT